MPAWNSASHAKPALPAKNAPTVRTAVRSKCESNLQCANRIARAHGTDGWHRYRACMDLGIKPVQFKFEEGDPVAFVLSHNLHRRHLTGSQRAAAVVACSNWAPPNIHPRGEAASPLLTNQDMAQAANVSDLTIKDAKAAHKAGLGGKVTSGELTAEKAAAIARGKPEKKKPAKAKQAEPPADPPPAEEGPDDAELQANVAATWADMEVMQ